MSCRTLSASGRTCGRVSGARAMRGRTVDSPVPWELIRTVVGAEEATLKAEVRADEAASRGEARRSEADESERRARGLSLDAARSEESIVRKRAGTARGI